MCPRDRLPRAEHLAEARLTGASRVACGEGAVNGNRQPLPPATASSSTSYALGTNATRL